MFKEFRDFIIKGNAIELAVGVIIAAAFGKVVSAVNEAMIMPVVSLFLGKADVSGLAFKIGDATIGYGVVMQSIIDLVITGFVLFIIVKGYNNLRKQDKAAPAGPSQTDLLAEIRDLLRK